MNKFSRLMVISAFCMAAVPAQGSHTAVVHRWSVRSMIDSVIKAVWTNRSREARIGGVSALVAGLGSLALWYLTRPSAETTVSSNASRSVRPELSYDAGTIQVAIDGICRYPATMTVSIRIEDEALSALIGGSGQTFNIACKANEMPQGLILRLYKTLIESNKTDIEKIAQLSSLYVHDLQKRLAFGGSFLDARSNLADQRVVHNSMCVLRAKAPSVGDLD